MPLKRRINDRKGKKELDRELSEILRECDNVLKALLNVRILTKSLSNKTGYDSRDLHRRLVKIDNDFEKLSLDIEVDLFDSFNK